MTCLSPKIHPLSIIRRPKSLILSISLLLVLINTSGLGEEEKGANELFVDILRDEAVDRIKELGKISDADNYLERTFLSPASIRASELIQKWMQDAGLRTWVDQMGNVHGRFEAVNSTAEALLIGSHLDTVIDAGVYDGSLGVICGISALKVLKTSGKLEKLHRPMEIWPPKSIKDTGSRLHSKVKEAIFQSGLGKNILGNHLVSLPTVESHAPPPPAFASDPLARITGVEEREKSGSSSVEDPTLQSSSVAMGPSKYSESEIIEVDGPSSLGNQFVSDKDPSFMKGESLTGVNNILSGATTRKGPQHVDRQNSGISYYADDEDGTRNKYNRMGPFRHKVLRFILPFWSSALPTLPVTVPPRKDRSNHDDVPEGRLRHQRSYRMDPRQILLTIAIMACMSTMGILYYRLAQGLGGNTKT